MELEEPSTHAVAILATNGSVLQGPQAVAAGRWSGHLGRVDPA